MSMSYRGCPFWESFLKDLKLRDSVFVFFGEEKPILFASLETSFCTLILNFLQKSPSSGFGS